jgi:uncharacterized membrane-anchored protein
MKTLVFWLGLALVSAAAAWLVQQKENVLAHGRTVLLELRPRDPRSLMQGDYMALRYALADQTPVSKLQRRGLLVVKLDANNVGKFERLHDSTALADDEQLIEYRNLNGIQIGAESFFFEERTGGTYNRAKYAELKISRDGECLLTHLCDEERVQLKPLAP